MKLLVLPRELRSELKSPLGTLCRGDGVECIMAMDSELKAAKKITAVGDMTAYYLLESSITPDLAIVDNKTKRMPAPEHVLARLEKNSYRTIEVENPAATLNPELIDLIRISLEGDEHIKILIDGEDDLATLPAILYSPIGSAVVYGQPDVGSVFVKVTAEKKGHVKDLMDRMVLEE